VADVLEVLEARDLRDVTLVGHSYGGMVLAGVTAVAADRLGHLVFLDAPVPHHGDAVFDHFFDFVAAWYRDQARAGGDDWRVPVPDPSMHGLRESRPRVADPDARGRASPGL
jgi:pimeloyl-ACP methyl ester carboxylesterase